MSVWAVELNESDDKFWTVLGLNLWKCYLLIWQQIVELFVYLFYCGEIKKFDWFLTGCKVDLKNRKKVKKWRCPQSTCRSAVFPTVTMSRTRKITFDFFHFLKDRTRGNFYFSIYLLYKQTNKQFLKANNFMIQLFHSNEFLVLWNNQKPFQFQNPKFRENIYLLPWKTNLPTFPNFNCFN